jgi:hypothetical protein
MDGAIDMLRRTVPQLPTGSDLAQLAEETLATFVRWRTAEPHSDRSATLAERFATLVRSLESEAKTAQVV